MRRAPLSTVSRAPPLFHFLHFWLLNEAKLSEQPEWLNLWSLPSDYVPSDWDSFLTGYPIRGVVPLDSWKLFCEFIRSQSVAVASYRETIVHDTWYTVYKWLKAKSDRKRLTKGIDRVLEAGLTENDHNVLALMKIHADGQPLDQCELPGQADFIPVQCNILRLVLGNLAAAPGTYKIANRSTRELWSAWIAGYIERSKKARRRAANVRQKKLDQVLKLLPHDFLKDPPQLNATKAKSLLTACDEYIRASGWLEEPNCDQGIIAERVGFLEAVINARSATQITLPGPASAARTRGATSGAIYALTATDDEVEEIVAIVEAWQARLRDAHQVDAASALDLPDIESGSVEWANTPDLGVEKYTNIPEAELCQLLGYNSSRPPTFAAYRNLDGLDGWAFPKINISFPDETNTEITLLWHQLVAVASILELAFTATSGTSLGNFPGVLLADEVGLGKTATSIAVMCMIADLASNSDTTLPPLLKNLPYFAGINGRCNKPMLVIVPNPLLQQWPSEIRTFVRPHALDIFVFPPSEGNWGTFWSTFEQSKQPPCRRVIIAAGSTLQRMASQQLDKHNSQLPETLCYHTRNKPLLWSIDYSVVIVDEAHAYRTPGNGASRALNIILQYSHFCLAITATPLYQKPSDLLTIGRFLRLPHCRGEAAFQFQRKNELEIARIRRSALKRVTLEHALSSRFKGNSYPPALEEYRTSAMRFVVEIRNRFANRIIRRSGQSKDIRGEPLQKAILPMEEINAHIDLHPMEESILSKLQADLKEMKGVIEASITDSFFLNYRLGAAYVYRQPGGTKYPPVQSLAEWNSRKGSKINALAALVVHALLARENEARFPALEDDGTLPTNFLEDIPTIPSDFPVTRKIVVYHEFALLTQLIASVLNLYGVTVWRYTGETAKGKREANLQAFKASKTGGVLLMTNVGAEGINMTEADTLISFDMFWSMVQDRQLRGRVYRMGQTKQVVYVRIIANGTKDVMIGHGGNVKADMLARFYEKSTPEATLANSEDEPDTSKDLESEEETIPLPRPKTTGKRMRRTTQKAPSTLVVETSDAEEAKEATLWKRSSQKKQPPASANNRSSDSAQVPPRKRVKLTQPKGALVEPVTRPSQIRQSAKRNANPSLSRPETQIQKGRKQRLHTE